MRRIALIFSLLASIVVIYVARFQGGLASSLPKVVSVCTLVLMTLSLGLFLSAAAWRPPSRRSSRVCGICPRWEMYGEWVWWRVWSWSRTGARGERSICGSEWEFEFASAWPNWVC